MSEFKGTKGIWKVEECSEIQRLHGIWHYNNEGFPTYIARTCYAPSSKANALLISKAPELLHELKEFVHFVSDGFIKDYEGTFDEWESECKERIAKAEQLIKSATPNLEAMPIEEVKMYGAICECCKESWYNDYHGWSAMSDESSLKEMLVNDDWHLEDGKTYCPSCYEIDDDDNLTIKVN